MSVVLNARGLPEPPSHMLERLKQIDPKFSLTFGMTSKTWWITMDWPESDPRWAKVRSGEWPRERAFDKFVQLPEGTTADDAFDYLVRVLRRNSGKADIHRLLERVDAYNKKRQRELTQSDLASELIETNAKTLFSAEGKHIPRTKAPRSAVDTDGQKLRDYLHDTGHVVTPTSVSR